MNKTPTIKGTNLNSLRHITVEGIWDTFYLAAKEGNTSVDLVSTQVGLVREDLEQLGYRIISKIDGATRYRNGEVIYKVSWA